MTLQPAKKFALIGAAGYIAPKHMKAIRDTGNKLVAAMDRNDSVGVIDSYAPDAAFFTEFERFDRYLEKRRREGAGDGIDFVSVCSPNYLHDAHCRLALRVGADAICEKPLVINPWNVEQLLELEQEYGKKVYSVLQLRLHPEVIALKQRIERSSGPEHQVRLTYISRRGKWYQQSWKGSEDLSGGLAMNIGVHFFDFLLWIFGEVQSSHLHLRQPDKLPGVLQLEKARVQWFLSTDVGDLPKEVVENGGYAYRGISVDGQEVDLSHGFTDLHTEVYRNILAGSGFGLADAKDAIDLIYRIRKGTVETPDSGVHPLLIDPRTIPKTS